MSDRWDRVGALFDAALALPAAERARFVNTAQEPENIRQEVVSLLASHEEAAGFLDKLPDSAALAEGDTLETEPEPPPLAEGTVVGPYRIGAVLGIGGMGVVYEGYDSRLHRRVAIKSLSPRFSRAERQRERLRQEARAAAALTHPGIATVFALEEVDGQLYIVSEYLDGETLRAMLERQRLSIPEALSIAIEMTQALSAAHDRGIVHRDLKPENVIRTTGGTLKILDFGLAQFEDTARDLVSMTRLTQSGMIAGTPPYMAPEQLLGHETDSRTDQFSLGVVLYELCTGRHAFGGHSLPSTIARILASDPIPPGRDEAIPSELWQVIERCLRKDPSQRFESTRALVAALEKARAAIVEASRAGEAGGASRASGAAFADELKPGVAIPADRLATPDQPAQPDQLALWWWRFHQLAAALSYVLMVWPVWHVHRAFGRAGLFFFLAVLATVVVAAGLRLHLMFTARVYPNDLRERLADAARWIRAADIAFAALLIIGAIALPADRAGWAALLMSFGIGASLAALFIEPATARALFRG
jgi:predicted Ser/Thr protein kinase